MVRLDPVDGAIITPAIPRAPRGRIIGGKRRKAACLDTVEAVRRQVPTWIDHYNREEPHKIESNADWSKGKSGLED